MVKHIILWKLKEEYSEKERAELSAEAKSRLEALNGRIDGLITLKVQLSPLPSSSADMMLYSEFTSAAALADYQKNPVHLEAAGFVRSIVEKRMALDFEA